MERTNDSHKRLISFFKQFVNTTLIKHFRNSEETLTQWNYFSSLLSQQYIDMDKIQLYLQVLSPKEQSSSPSKLQLQSKLKTEENTKTNSGIYSKKNQTINEVEKIDFQPNRTVGGNLDRIKYTGMVSQKANPYTFDLKQKKKIQKNDIKTGGISALIDGLTTLNNQMLENHLRLQNKSQNTFSIQTHSTNHNINNNNNTNMNTNNNNSFRYRGQQRYPI